MMPSFSGTKDDFGKETMEPLPLLFDGINRSPTLSMVFGNGLQHRWWLVSWRHCEALRQQGDTLQCQETRAIFIVELIVLHTNLLQ